MTELQIQAYVMGELPPEEAALVAEAIAQDRSLAALEQEYQTIKEGFRRQRVQALQQKMLAYDKTLPPPPTPPASRGWAKGLGFWLTTFVSVMLICSGAWVFWQMNEYADDAIAHRYFKAPPNPSTASGADDRLLFLDATEHYFSGDYASAHTSFEELAKGETFSASSKLFLPHASFELEAHKRAAKEFLEGLSDENLDATDLKLLRWNQLVNDLALGKDVRTRIEDEDWPQSFRADDLIKELNSAWR